MIQTLKNKVNPTDKKSKTSLTVAIVGENQVSRRFRASTVHFRSSCRCLSKIAGRSDDSPVTARELTFSDMSERKRTIWHVIDAIHQEALATIPGIRRLQIKEMGSDVMATAAAPRRSPG